MLIYNPRQIVLITCQGILEIMGVDKEIHDVVPCTWHAPASAHPPQYAIFLNKQLSAVDLIRNAQSFVVNFVSWKHVDTVRKAQEIAPEHENKAEALGLGVMHTSVLIDNFRLKENIGWLECEIKQEIEVGDHICFVGQVVHSSMGVDDKRAYHVKNGEFTTTN